MRERERERECVCVKAAKREDVSVHDRGMAKEPAGCRMNDSPVRGQRALGIATAK